MFNSILILNPLSTFTKALGIMRTLNLALSSAAFFLVVLAMWKPATAKVVTISNQLTDNFQVYILCKESYTIPRNISVQSGGSYDLSLDENEIEGPQICMVDGRVTLRALLLPCRKTCYLIVNREGYFIWDERKNAWETLWDGCQNHNKPKIPHAASPH